MYFFYALQLLFEIFFDQINSFQNRSETPFKELLFWEYDFQNEICGYFHYHIRNQCLKIHRYREFQINQRYLSVFRNFIPNLNPLKITSHIKISTKKIF